MTPYERVEAAHQQIEIAEALGYGEKGDLDNLDDTIDTEEDTGLFDRIGDS